jgi:hypothetical protein
MSSDAVDEVHAVIEALVAEEHQLWEAAANGTATDSDREQLERVKVNLDRYWDLLRRRRAAEETGGDPEAVELRPEDTVEGYIQ